MSSAKVFKRIKLEPITVKEPHKYNIMEFADPEEFTAYYRENEDKFKNVSKEWLIRFLHTREVRNLLNGNIVPFLFCEGIVN